MSPLSLISNKLLGGALAGSLLLSGGLGIALAFKNGELNSAKEVIQDLTQWQDDMVTAVSLAAETPETTKVTARAQIQQMGYDRLNYQAAIEQQNEMVEALIKETEASQEIARKEAEKRAVVIDQVERARVKVRELQSTNDSLETYIREIQDIQYEAGL